KTAQCGRDQRAGTRQAEAPGDGGAISNGEIFPADVDPFFAAILNKTANGGLHKANTAVIAIAFYVIIEIRRRFILGAILEAGNNFQLGAFVETDFGGEIANYKTNGFAVVSVGWVANEPGAGVGGGFTSHGELLCRK